MNLVDDLNPQQRAAVLATEGPVLALAGAGTGKTRVITYRIAHLIAGGTDGASILGITFTNKAAEQMRERVMALLARLGQSTAEPWIYTFHAFCARLLRREAPRVGLPRGFAIYDEDDQAQAVKLALSQLGLSERNQSIRAHLERISFRKNQGHTEEPLAGEAADEQSQREAKVFAAYEGVLRQAGALDFDDLLLRAVEVLRRFGEARSEWNARFRYLHVDEYQDTNRVQYELLRLLAGERRNLCVVGDEDQSIYSWRGADAGNIVRFPEDFSGARVIRLEQNYRSTQKILNAASAVVAKNLRRLGKSLAATKGLGANLEFFEARDSKAEAQYVAVRISQLVREDLGCHVAVLYRTNSQSRAFEEELRRLGIRYRMLGGFSFYQRAEIKDALAYMRLALNPNDDVALLRVLNTPPRGIGAGSLERLRDLGREAKGSLWSVIERALDSETIGRAVTPLREFREQISEFRAELQQHTPAEFLNLVLEHTGYLEMLKQRDTAEATARLENLRELVNALEEGSQRGETLADLLDRAALVSSADDYDENARVTLLTLHSAKGLEFDHVFLTGLEEGVFPHSRSQAREQDIEEERRLCYVGMTRARETLTLTRAVYRRVLGNERLNRSSPSRFLLEIPGELVDTAPGSLAAPGETRRYEPDPEYSFSAAEFARRVRREPHRARSAGSDSPAAYRSEPRPGNSNPLLGVLVRHPTYGVGTIIGVDGDDENRKLTVSFPGHGTKKLVERFANLERM